MQEKIQEHGISKEILNDASLYRVDRRAALIEPDAAGYQSKVSLVEIG